MNGSAGADRPAGAAGLTLAAVAACFTLSGFAALLYQTAWLRSFSIVFGTSELAVAAVLAAYMAGLAAGAALGAWLVPRVRRHVLTYGLLEGGIALSALLVPVLIELSGRLYALVVGGQAGPPAAQSVAQTLYFLSAGFIILAVPTVLMGATLPVLVRFAVRTNAELGGRTALLYALNTVGAVAGAIAAGFVLLPAIGLAATVWTGVAVNVLIFGIAAGVLRDRSAEATAAVESATTAMGVPSVFAACIAPLVGSSSHVGSGRRLVQREWVLPLMLVSGANSFFLEVLLTRLLSHVLGGTIYAFATMLAAFLSGIAIGSWGGGFLARTQAQAQSAFVYTQALIAASIAAVFVLMPLAVPESRNLTSSALFAAIVMLPATVFIGATFPLAVRILARRAEEAASAAGRVYSWNTVGAIVGSIGAGFVLIPWLGYEGSAHAAVSVSLVIAGSACWLLATHARTASAAVSLVCLVAILLYGPSRPDTIVERSALDGTVQPGQEIFFAVGRNATVRVVAVNGRMAIQTNGLPEATVLPLGAPVLDQTHQWLSALALAARPTARTMLVVGLGGGIALERLPASLESVDVVELEQAVIDANRMLSPFRAADPLADERIRIVVNDARNALRLSARQYDLIVSQPSHPWTAGASHLYTREYLELAHARLEDGGVLVQWMSASFVDEALLSDLAATMRSVFAHVRLYQNGPALYFLGSDAPLDIERQILDSGQPLSANVLYYSYLGLNAIDDFVAALALDEAGVTAIAAHGAINTDDFNRMATHSFSQGDGLDALEFLEFVKPYDPLLDADGWIHTELAPNLNFPYIATRLIANGRGQRAVGMEEAVSDAATRAVVRGVRFSATGENERAVASLREAIELDPNQHDARFALIQPYLSVLASGRAGAEIDVLAERLPASADAVLRGWRAALGRNYEALSRLERELAAARTTDLWFAESIRLRADWRLQVDDERQQRDAIRLVDRALVLRPSLDLMMLRLAASDALNDDASFVESARTALPELRAQVTALAANGRRTTQAEVDLSSRRLSAVRQGLAAVGRDYTGFGLDGLRDEIDELLAETELLKLQLGR